ncbi:MULTISPECIES: vWA domain-containing protein [Mucilaginibacter]|uniref:VWA domain-containing protein n=1 Tax=Mucilaginibacter rubeus TaxID=2027860 RepID=A0ABX7UE89_9SPHI|nr:MULTISPECIES: VWA domain-containing protein [Mucilaginibacter]QTE44303.1 VWA domain-containing protein [Mucilaginibacter rubeus]QTE50903.1 VWA domain-containing protein [Mucilaginibacter rubeus]QTE55986.1 VWA domain-containing protein [Mucilaginibacter rubeus]QTE64551.1 VWA domain-containing protein [Mucilaginibacter rubeus]QTF63311.1 VWA domain-containing protein [Mucilaginibacter rubeus]
MIWFKGIEFAHPGFFWLFISIPLMVGWYIWKQKQLQGNLAMPTVRGFAMITKSMLPRFRHLNIILRSLAMAALIVALARPQSSLSWQDTTTEGIDIVIASDISGSMLAEDFKPNRLEAGKNIAIDFIQNRPNDRIGLVVFSGESFTQCPLTIDHSVLVNLYADIKNGMIEDGTAIGMGLATAVNRLKDSEAKSKVVILLTDGSNNSGSIPPVTAAEIAKQFGVRVYTVGIGTNGFAPYPVQTPMGIQYQRMKVDIDEGTLSKIATITGGKYFRATNNNALKDIYEQIDKLEKAKIDVTQYRKKTERFLPFAIIALALLSLEFLTRNTLLKGAIT